MTAANEADGVVASRVVQPLLGYLHRMEKILADQAYKKVFMEWVENTIAGLEVEISSAPASKKGFVPVKYGSLKELLEALISLEGSIKTMKKQQVVRKIGYYRKIVKLFSIEFDNV